ncbi:50S ribosomal protein L23 [Candidatus Microgenomates bacterium]|nr:50S ribosomal protein L23 [Candidatus Microgenomates bacterium]
MKKDQILTKPVITEKSLQIASLGWYTFVVVKEANKKEIKKAVEDQFKVNVLAVKTVIMKGKTKKVGRRRAEVKQSPWKKAIVRLKPDQKISLFEVTQ